MLRDAVYVGLTKRHFHPIPSIADEDLDSYRVSIRQVFEQSVTRKFLPIFGSPGFFPLGFVCRCFNRGWQEASSKPGRLDPRLQSQVEPTFLSMLTVYFRHDVRQYC